MASVVMRRALTKRTACESGKLDSAERASTGAWAEAAAESASRAREARSSAGVVSLLMSA